MVEKIGRIKTIEEIKYKILKITFRDPEINPNNDGFKVFIKGKISNLESIKDRVVGTFGGKIIGDIDIKKQSFENLFCDVFGNIKNIHFSTRFTPKLSKEHQLLFLAKLKKQDNFIAQNISFQIQIPVDSAEMQGSFILNNLETISVFGHLHK